LWVREENGTVISDDPGHLKRPGNERRGKEKMPQKGQGVFAPKRQKGEEVKRE